jgi:hypothetical protein
MGWRGKRWLIFYWFCRSWWRATRSFISRFSFVLDDVSFLSLSSLPYSTQSTTSLTLHHPNHSVYSNSLLATLNARKKIISAADGIKSIGSENFSLSLTRELPRFKSGLSRASNVGFFFCSYALTSSVASFFFIGCGSLVLT